MTDKSDYVEDTGQLFLREIFGFAFLMLIALMIFNALVAAVLV